MVSIKIILEKRKPKRDGSFPLYFQICFKRKTTTRSTKISINESCWDEDKKEIKRNHPNFKLLNQSLKKQFADIQSELLLADEEKVISYFKPKATIAFVQTEVEILKTKKTVFQFAEELIKDLKLSNKIGNAWVYESTVNALKGYHPNEILFEQIDYLFLEDYQKHLLKREIKPNSIYLYIRTIRIFYNKAIKQKLVDKALYPFDDFKLRPERTRKRAIDKELIKQIKNLSLVEDSTIWHVRNWFLLSFYLIGISVIDLALLIKKNYHEGRIEYKRKKTGKWYDIKIVPQAAVILKLYLNSDKTSGEYILPIINYQPKNEENLMRIVKSRTKLINKYIKKLAEMIEYDGEITSYTVRHSWATTAKKMGYSNEVIAEALGHEYGNAITNVYLDKFDKVVVDEANEKVSSSLE
ncbi:site-specific integrase [Daejeonella oryzae]|uniref:site-specific integrase n=1 Tax=Daejeonella oryzae TaxID=1122943 RepID=UPI00138B02F9|nr:site-specific integrase [Daejeonella oryzae]